MAGRKIRKRNRVEIDNHSYLDAFPEAGIRNITFFIHGILGSYKETWSDTPVQLMSYPAFSNSDFGSFGYETNYIDLSNSNKVADQLILWMRTHLCEYQSIFIIAHSMGGLIVRQACTRLLTSGKPEDRALFGKIRHCFLIAVPLSGSWLAKMLNCIPLLSKVNRKLPLLALPDIAENYQEALNIAQQYNLPKPGYSIFVGTQDIIVQQPESWALCPNDTYEGPVPGTHADIKIDQNANSTLVNRIVQIIESCLQTQPTVPNLVQDNVQPLKNNTPTKSQHVKNTVDNSNSVSYAGPADHHDVILIPCSATKGDEGAEFFAGEDQLSAIPEWQPLYQSLISKRKKVKDLIESGNFIGHEFSEGNRASRQQNQNLIVGPDFGGVRNEKRFLPGYQRYRGRCYQATVEEWQQFYQLPPLKRPMIIIVSGLYGLFSADQAIQNYDCHFSDIDKSTGHTIAMYWQELLTDLLIARLKNIELNGYQVGAVYDFLCEPIYQQVIDWQNIKESWPVRRLQFEKSVGREALDGCGVLLRKVITDPSLLSKYRHDEYYQDSLFISPDRFMFVTI